MTFRDDHDAALTRAEALEDEVVDEPIEGVVGHDRKPPRVVDRTPHPALAIEPPERAPRAFEPLAIFVLLVILAGFAVSAWIIAKGKPHAAENSRVQSGSGR